MADESHDRKYEPDDQNQSHDAEHGHHVADESHGRKYEPDDLNQSHDAERGRHRKNALGDQN